MQGRERQVRSGIWSSTKIQLFHPDKWREELSARAAFFFVGGGSIKQTRPVLSTSHQADRSTIRSRAPTPHVKHHVELIAN